jgi:RNA polymerase sigma-70 factor (ECF subfamily)
VALNSVSIDELESELQAPSINSDDPLDISRCLQRLPADQRAVLLLVVLEDMSYKEAAKVLAIPMGTVMSRLSRARSRLRELMEAGRPAPGQAVTGQPTALRRMK